MWIRLSGSFTPHWGAAKYWAHDTGTGEVLEYFRTGNFWKRLISCPHYAEVRSWKVSMPEWPKWLVLFLFVTLICTCLTLITKLTLSSSDSPDYSPVISRMPCILRDSSYSQVNGALKSVLNMCLNVFDIVHEFPVGGLLWSCSIFITCSYCVTVLFTVVTNSNYGLHEYWNRSFPSISPTCLSKCRRFPFLTLDVMWSVCCDDDEMTFIIQITDCSQKNKRHGETVS